MREFNDRKSQNVTEYIKYNNYYYTNMFDDVL